MARPKALQTAIEEGHSSPMAVRQAIRDYLNKSFESLSGAVGELANRRFNNCANRCYYACFQAAIAALVEAGIQVHASSGRLRHD